MVTGVEQRKAEEAIAHAAPSPVDVEETFSIVAVAHESVTHDIRAADRCTRQIDRALGNQFIVYHLLPISVGIFISIHYVSGVIIVKYSFNAVGTNSETAPEA